MRFDDFILSLTTEECRAYARRAVVAHRYLRTHLTAPVNRRRDPRPLMTHRLLREARGAVNELDMYVYFKKEIGEYHEQQWLLKQQLKAERNAQRKLARSLKANGSKPVRSPRPKTARVQARA